MADQLRHLNAKLSARRALVRPSTARFPTFLLLAIIAAADPTRASETLTPLLLSVPDAPVPFVGSDGRTHLVYELQMTNFSSGEIAVTNVRVLGDGTLLQTLGADAVSERLQSVGLREASGSLAKSTASLLFVHLVLEPGRAIPRVLSHRVAITARAAPIGQQDLTETGGDVTVDRRAVVVLSPPLAGTDYVSADSCCDATRHTRAVLPVNGRAWVAQRFAVDWEQLNASGSIYAGPKEKLESYTIFGQPVLAVADGVVVSVVDGEPEQTPGTYPTDISPGAADGNAIVLDLGAGRYALYAHLQPGSIRVQPGTRVTAGQILGLVGDSGNSIVPHLHFQVMDAPSSLAANGLPYEISSFQITGMTSGTKAFDDAEAHGSPLSMSATFPARQIRNAMPLDQLIVTFAAR